MSTPLHSIFRKIFRKDGDVLNILTFPFTEAYDAKLAATGHRFFCIVMPYKPKHKLPSNYLALNAGENKVTMPGWIDLDIVISHDKGMEYNIADGIGRELFLPHITVEHNMPNPSITPTHLSLESKKAGDLAVFESPEHEAAWLCKDGIVNSFDDPEFIFNWQEIFKKALEL